jgi:hypothetical protein
MDRMQLARIVAALTLVALTACSQGLSKEEFIEQADRICRESDEKTREIEPPRTAAALEDFVDQAQTITQDLLADLRELEVPEGDADVIENMTGRIENAMELLPEIQAAAEQRNLADVNRLATELKEEAGEANRIAQDYGLEECGRSDPAPVP